MEGHHQSVKTTALFSFFHYFKSYGQNIYGKWKITNVVVLDKRFAAHLEAL